MENNDPDYKNINGWGIDADPRNEPTYPMKKYTGDDHNRLNYERPPLQPVDVEILHSNERPNVSAVFGTSNPPKGLSGAIRRFAFRYSENQYRHWLPLLLADRVNVFEGVIDDISKGHVPNFFAESGWNAEWKYNKKGLIAKVITRVAIITAVIAIVRYRKKEKKLW
jgi:hypothetical protein